MNFRKIHAVKFLCPVEKIQKRSKSFIFSACPGEFTLHKTPDDPNPAQKRRRFQQINGICLFKTASHPGMLNPLNDPVILLRSRTKHSIPFTWIPFCVGRSGRIVPKEFVQADAGNARFLRQLLGKIGFARSAGADNMYLHFLYPIFYGLYVSFSTISYMLFPAFASK